MDLIAATRHDEFAFEDYSAVAELGLPTVRDGIRWHLIEAVRDRYDFRSAVHQLRAARKAGVQVIWDVVHYGWPDWLDVFSHEFPERLGKFARAFAVVLRNETFGDALLCPLNEQSFLSWAGGDQGWVNPFATGRGFELKQQLVRATIAAVDAIREELPRARIIHCEPAIHIAADPEKAWTPDEVGGYRMFQFQALDMLAGAMCPELGGGPQYLDILGLNFYWNNEWVHNGRTLLRNDSLYRPFRELLREYYDRYQCPLFVSETGNEGDRRPAWLRYVVSEVEAAINEGTPVWGICLYPILNHPGWDNDRYCTCGLLDYPDEKGKRRCYSPLANELLRCQQRATEVQSERLAPKLSKRMKKPISLICLSHLRWGFVYQRPQHLMTRFAREHDVFFIEEPVISPGSPRLETRVDSESQVHVVVPHLPAGLSQQEAENAQSKLLEGLVESTVRSNYFVWYYTPMALGFSRELAPSLIVYDCMDELSGFLGAPSNLQQRERDLFERANLVFTGGHSLFEAKRERHPDIHAFPSSVDVEHFRGARSPQPDPADQAAIPSPRIGYCGVIDERMDMDLLRRAAELRPDWHFVMLGPVVKIDPAELPKRRNIHYLGGKDYKQLPQYMAGWTAAMLPFALNESTRFISPTKTPEYLAAGLPVVSTPIRDVVRPYGEMGLIQIADGAESFVTAMENAIAGNTEAWRQKRDSFLQENSWDTTWRRMMDLIEPHLSPAAETGKAESCLTI